MKLNISLIGALALNGMLASSAIAASGPKAEAQRQPGNPCTALESRSSTSSAGGEGSHSSSVITRNDGSTTVVTRKNGIIGTNEECRVVECGPSSTVTTGPGGLSSSTTMPGGSSVTVRSRGASSGSDGATASSSSSSTSAGSSGSAGGSSAAAGSGQDIECETTVYPDARDQRRDQKPRQQER